MTSADLLFAHFAEAVGEGFMLRAENSYHFLRERVQEAAYNLIRKTFVGPE